jgi:hypothetical protein
MKKVSIIISLFVLTGLGYWAFSTFVNNQQQVFDPLIEVPNDAILILELRNGGKGAATFYQRSMVWKDFENTQFAKETFPFFQIIDSLNEKTHLVLSLHQIDNQNYSMITSSDLDNHLTDLVLKFGAKKNTNTGLYSIAGIGYFIDLNDGFIRISKSESLLVTSKKKIINGESILTDSSFVSIRSDIESKNNQKLFINLNAFSASLNENIIEKRFHLPQNLSGWIASDLYDKANTIVSSGFIEFKGPSDHFFNAYNGQTPQGLHYFDILPANTAFLTASGQSNPSAFLDNLSDSKDQDIQNCKNYFSSWLGNSFGSAILSGKRPQSELQYAFFEIRDKETFVEKTDLFIDATFSVENFRNYTLHKLNSSYNFSCFTNGFTAIKSPYYTFIKDYVIFCNSKETLKEIIKRYINDNTLSKQESFFNLRDELSDETSFLFYISPAMAGSFLHSEFTDSVLNYWIPDEEKRKMMQAFVIQISSYKPGKMYVHSVLRHQVVNFEEKDNSLWELNLNAPIKGDVFLLRNHYTQHLEIAVQDSNNVLYLINNKGELLWEKALNEEIIGNIRQLDIYKNGKLQLIFNTSKAIYCLDRKGNDLNKFPIIFKTPTNISLSVLDYNSRKDYRILMGFPDGNLRMYNAKGDKLKGWKFKKVRSAITESPRHIRIGKKDYIYTTTGNGTVLLLDRKGKNRYKVKENVADKYARSYYYVGKSISTSGMYYMDTLGSVINLPFGGQKDYLAIKGEKGDQLYMAKLNEDNSREFVLYNSQSISVINLKGDNLYDKIIVKELGGAPKKFRFDKQNWLGYTDNDSQEAYLLDKNGEIRIDAPYFGRGNFRMGDINKDGTMELVIIGDKGQLIVHSLSK